MMAFLERLAFRWRTRSMLRDLNAALATRCRNRAERQERARRGWETRFQRRMEGLKR